MPLDAGTQLGRYQIIEPLASGGMGEVYRARDTQLHRVVAIKVLPEAFATDVTARARFEREAQAAAALSHSNVMTVHDFGHVGSVPFVVMELLEGETLRERLMRGPLAWNRATAIAKSVADGLAAAHRAGVVHRDIKPGNLFITTDGQVKILDFGIARLETPAIVAGRRQGIYRTDTGEVLGTIGYMSPEQAAGKPFDARSDIFSLGCVLFEMVAGSKPFERASPTATVVAIVNEEAPALSDLGAEVPFEFEAFLKNCLKKDPKDRWQSAAELSAALESLLSLSHDPATDTVTKVSFGGPRRWLRWAAVATAVAVVVTLAAWWLLPRLTSGADDDQPIDSLAVLPLLNHSEQADDYFADGLTEALISELARIHALRVVSRTSVLRYRDTTKSLPEIAEELNVDAVVEGSVIRSEDRVRVSVRVINARTDEHLFGRSFESHMANILALQSEIAGTVAREIRVTITPQEEQRLQQEREVEPAAHEAYLRGRYLLNQRTRDGAQKAIEFFNDAIVQDPEYALGYAGLADAYILLAKYADRPPRERIERARAAATRALELDPMLAEVHTTLGIISSEFDWDWEAGERYFKRALELNHGYSIAHERYAMLLAGLARFDDARFHAEMAEEFDPLAARALVVLAWVLYFRGDFDGAIERCHQTLEVNPEFGVASAILAFSLHQKGSYGEAIVACLNAASSLSNDPELEPDLGYIYAVKGDKQVAREMLARFDDRGYTPAWARALLYVGLGESAPAIQWLERAREEHFPWLQYLAVDPRFEPLYGDPRFEELLDEMKLPSSARK